MTMTPSAPWKTALVIAALGVSAVVFFTLPSGCRRKSAPPEPGPTSAGESSAASGRASATTAIRTDGLYVADDSSATRHYLRFTDQEVWIASSDQTPAEVAKMIGSEQDRRPSLSSYSVDGDRVTITGHFLTAQAALRENTLIVTIVDDGTQQAATSPRTYQFVVAEELATVTSHSRHLAACYAKYSDVMRLTNQLGPTGPTDTFFAAMESLVQWIEMTPSERQKISSEPAIHQSVIPKLRGASVPLLTPVGGQPPPVLFQHHARWKPIMQKIIVTQIQHQRDAGFFVDWYCEMTPPPMIVASVRELTYSLPATDAVAEQLERGIRSIPFQAVPGGRQFIAELAGSNEPAWQRLAVRLMGGPTQAPPAVSGPPANRPPTNRPPTNASIRPTPPPPRTLETRPPWKLVAVGDDNDTAIREWARFETGDDGQLILGNRGATAWVAFQYDVPWQGDFLLKWKIVAAAVGTDNHQRTVRVRAHPLGPGATPFFSAFSFREGQAEAEIEIQNTNGVMSFHHLGTGQKMESNVGDQAFLQITMQGEVDVRVQNIEVSRPHPVDIALPLRELDILNGDLPNTMSDEQLQLRFAAAIVHVDNGQSRHPGLVIGSDGWILTTSAALRTGFLRVHRARDEQESSPSARLVRADAASGLALIKFDPQVVLPAPALARRATSEGVQRVLNPAHDPLVVTWNVASDLSSTAEGTTVFNDDGQVAGMVVNEPTSGSRQLIDARGLVALLIQWSDREAGNAAIYRTWADDSGMFQVRARLVAVEDDAVILQREAGQRVDVPLERLSLFDRRFITLLKAR